MNDLADPHAKLQKTAMALAAAVLEIAEAEFLARGGPAAGLDFMTVFEEVWIADLESSFLTMIIDVMEKNPSTANRLAGGVRACNFDRTNQKIVVLAEAFIARTAAAAALAEIDEDRQKSSS